MCIMWRLFQQIKYLNKYITSLFIHRCIDLLMKLKWMHWSYWMNKLNRKPLWKCMWMCCSTHCFIACRTMGAPTGSLRGTVPHRLSSRVSCAASMLCCCSSLPSTAGFSLATSRWRWGDFVSPTAIPVWEICWNESVVTFEFQQHKPVIFVLLNLNKVFELSTFKYFFN